MKILMLTPYLPYPPSSGGQVRTYNLLKYLSRKNKITLISLYKYEYERKYLKHLQRFCERIYLCKRAEKPWQPKNVLRAIFLDKPFLVVRNFSSEAKETAENLLKREQFDVIHAETFYIMPHLPETKVPVVLVEQTIEYQVYQHFVDSLPFFLRPVFRLDILKLIRWERYYWRKASLVAAVSESDRQKISRLEPKVKPIIIPNGAGDEMLEIPLKGKSLSQPKLFFIGNFSWLQNVEAANILIKEIYPSLKQEIPNLEVVIAGQYANNKLGRTVSRRLKIVDIRPDDTESVKRLYREATLFIAPIYGPGGTRLKILAAMAAGLPIVSTQVGVEGLALKDGKDVLIANRPGEFKERITGILSNEKLFRKVQKNSYGIVRDKYSWKNIAGKLEQAYDSLK